MNDLTPTAEFAPEELARRLEGLVRLLEVTRSLAAEIDLEEILRTIAVNVRDAVDCERASVYQFAPETDELYTTVVTDVEIARIRRPIDRGITGRVARTRQLANVANPPSDPDWDPTYSQVTGFPARNILAAPLTSARDDSLLGVLQLLNKHDGAFDATDEQLLQAFSQHAAVAIDRARLVEELRQRQATLSSLEVARRVQRSFMPQSLPAIPGYEVATWWYPNEAVGGDYCDVVPLADGRWGLVMADVSGHGLGPSLIMASVRAALRALLLEHESTDVLMRLLARSLAADLAGGLFITMILAALDADHHLLDYTNAGHGPAFVFRAATGQFVELAASGLPLGVEDAPTFGPTPPIHLEPGDLVFFCTDGIVDAHDSAGKRFGQQRLEALIAEHRSLPVQELVVLIGQAVEAYYVGDSPPDDLTILAARRRT